VLFYDLPASEQITAVGSFADYRQRSHIFSLDATYDLLNWLSLGAKYGLRIGEITASRTSDDFFSSTAHLGILRLDAHVISEWDFLLEQRILSVTLAEDLRYGTLIALYKHLGDHLKAGVGYNFADFSDDLTVLDYDDHGVFFNILSKF